MLSAFARRAFVVVAAVAATTACTVHDANTPTLNGPSGLALSLRVTADPASIAFGPNAATLGDQSVIKVTAIGPDGRLIPNLSVRLNIVVDGVAQDYGTLTNRNISTGSDGTASTTYTAPPSPSNGVISNNCGGSTLGTCISIVATPTSSNFGTVNPESVQVRLVPPGVILPPASTPTAAFTFSPTQPTANVPVQFDASTSVAGSGATEITSFSWSFGDGSTATGRTPSHTFTAGNNFNVTLTVTNDRGLSASTSRIITIGNSTLPSASFTISPTAPSVNEPVFFNGSSSTPGVGHQSITSYRWTFGDGSTASGQTVSHAYSASGTYVVQLTVTDDAGLSATSGATTVTVGGLLGPTANFTVSPSSPAIGDTVLFDWRTSTPAQGQAIVSLDWNFGDATPPVHCPGNAACASDGITTHVFQRAGTFTVTLVVTDAAGRTGLKSTPVTVSTSTGGGGATIAAFTFSPLSPSALQPVFFNASGSSAGSGRTLTTYAWNFGDGTLITGSTFSATHTFAAAGTFTVTLTVTDDAGQQGRVTAPVTVTAAGSGSLTADFSISPTDPHSGQLVSFNANLSSPTSSITSYDWDFGDGTVVNGQTSFLINHTYFTPFNNTFTIRLTVHDNTGRIATTTKPLPVIAGTDPTASFTVSPSPATVSPAVVTFDGSTSSAVFPKTIARFTWDFGDGSAIFSPVPPTTATATHSYAATGTYVIRLTVTDSSGLSSSTTRTLLVQ